MSVISKLKVAIGTDTSELEQGLDKSKKRLSGFGAEVRDLWNKIAQAGRQAGTAAGGTDQVKALQEEIRRLGAELEKYDAQLKRSQASGRGAVSSFNSLGFSVQQVARELPSLSMSFNQFFLAVSNNLPMLADEMKRASAANKALAAEGKKGVPVWRQVGSALLSWQTALVVGITLLSSYGNEIGKWVKELFSASGALDGTAEAQKRLSEGQREGVASAQEELQKLQLLRREAEQGNGMESRLAAVAELQKLYPDYLGNIDRERLLAGEAGDAYALLSEHITKTAVARAKFDKLVAAAKEQEELQGTFETLLKSQEGLWEEYEAKGIEAVRAVQARFREEAKRSAQATGNMSLTGTNAWATLNTSKTPVDGIIEAYDKLAAKQQEVAAISAGIDVGDLLGGEAKAGEERARTLAEALAMEEETLAAIREKIGAYEELRDATSIEDQERQDFYTRELARLEELARKTEELSQARVLSAMKSADGGPVEQRVVYGVEEAAADVRLSFPEADEKAMVDGLQLMRTEAEATKESFIDLSGALQQSVAGMATGFGEGLGELLAGGTSLKGFAALVGQTFGDMAVNVGKVAIQTGTAVIGIKAALKSLNPWAAIAAGVALVALGTAVKSSLGNIADGGSGTFSGQSMGNSVSIGGTSDYSQQVETARIEVAVSGELRAKGNQLVAALNAEGTRRRLTT